MKPTAKGSSLVALAHDWRDEDKLAIDAAILARRPLLVRGEPGVGKTQLALAAAQDRGWAFRQSVINARSEAQDLLWTEDLVARLAEAQLVGTTSDHSERRNRLARRNFLRPGPLWWAFEWQTARELPQVGSAEAECDVGDPEKGVVVLIDEIDKAESELPNGLLEALGAGRFTPTEHAPVRCPDDKWPLIVITTNEERRLPDAFLRRCVVHDMRLPDDAEKLKLLLVQRGARHFPKCSETILLEAARQTVADRQVCIGKRLRPLPGQAEYLDLLRAVLHDDPEGRHAGTKLEKLSGFFLRKHAALR